MTNPFRNTAKNGNKPPKSEGLFRKMAENGNGLKKNP